MHNKTDLRLHLERILLILKGQGIAAVVPILFINLLIPLLIFLIYLSKGLGEELTLSVNQLLQLFGPFLSSWWVIFAIKLFVEEKGCEVLFVNSDKTKLLDLFLLFFIMIANICITSIPYFFVIDLFYKTLFKTILVSFFYFSVSYCTSFFTKSITPALLLITIYTLANMFSFQKETMFPFYYSPEASTNIFACEIPLFLVGIILLIIGLIFVKKGH